ncbi:MAG TPA: riboflavin synthase [Dehalococcoidia bacterium]|nr:riboflavin synthase [Dehalococcoidia bacterium]
MFTGIIEELGTIEAIREDGLSVRADKVLADAHVGDSICINGVCLTVTAMHDGVFSVDTVPETQRRTNLGELAPGDPVNLERALRPNDRMGGHFVQGHVEGTSTVEAVTPDGPALMIRFAAPPELMRYIVAKGFIAIDGASLTVVDRDQAGFSVTIIPLTQQWTTLGRRRPGDRVNLETDILAKYVEQIVAGRAGSAA